MQHVLYGLLPVSVMSVHMMLLTLHLLVCGSLSGALVRVLTHEVT